MSKQSHEHEGPSSEPRRSLTQTVVDYCMPDEHNVKGPERAGRAVIGVGIGGFGITGVIAAERLVLGAALTVVLLVVAGYLLATAKTQKCPVKHVASKPLRSANR